MSAVKIKQRRGAIHVGITSRLHLRSDDYDSLMLINGLLSTIDLTPSEYLDAIDEASDLTGRPGRVLAKIRVLALRWGFNLADIAESVAEEERDGMFKAFLRRMSQAIRSGSKMRDFLRIEYTSYFLTIQRLLEQAAERAKIVTDAYTALLTSMLFMFITILLSSVLFGLGDPISIGTTFLLITSALGALMLILVRHTLPPYRLFHKMQERPNKLSRVNALVNLAVPTSFSCVLASSGIILAGYPPLLGYGAALMLGIALLLIGVLTKRLQGLVLTINDELPQFIKTLGDASSIAGSLIGGLRQLLNNDYGPLSPMIRRLYSRLRMGVSPDIAWRMFQSESLSELLRTHIGAMLVAARVGADMERSSEVIYESAKSKNEARRKRQQIAGYAKGTLIPLQAVMVAVATLTASLLRIFQSFSSMVEGELPFFATVTSPEVLFGVSYAFMAISTVINSLYIYQIESGSTISLTWTSALFLVNSGAAGIATYAFSETIFSMFMSLGSVVS